MRDENFIFVENDFAFSEDKRNLETSPLYTCKFSEPTENFSEFPSVFGTKGTTESSDKSTYEEMCKNQYIITVLENQVLVGYFYLFYEITEWR